MMEGGRNALLLRVILWRSGLRCCAIAVKDIFRRIGDADLIAFLAVGSSRGLAAGCVDSLNESDGRKNARAIMAGRLKQQPRYGIRRRAGMIGDFLADH